MNLYSGKPLLTLNILQVMRVEWAKTLARADRWDEETDLSCEEMRRVLETFERKSKWWLEQAGCRPNEPEAVQRGIAAYASKQAAMYVALGKSFGEKWYPFLVYKGLGDVEWPSDYIPIVYTPYKPTPKDLQEIVPWY